MEINYKHWKAPAAAAAAALGVLALGQLTTARRATAYASPEELLQAQRAQMGMKIAPVTLKTEGLNPALVGYGSYLVNAVGGCVDCHSNPTYATGGNPFQGQPARLNSVGYLGGGQEFGPFTSRNLTPEPEKGNLPAGMTFSDFVTVMRTGIDMDKKHPDMGPLLQVMPWPAYANMTDYDLRAIYEYLRAVPPVTVANAK